MRILKYINDFFVLVFVFFINIYKKTISPFVGARCRFYPTCSSYAIDALNKRGAFIGFILIIKRIIRCNPLSDGGIDFVK